MIKTEPRSTQQREYFFVSISFISSQLLVSVNVILVLFGCGSLVGRLGFNCVEIQRACSLYRLRTIFDFHFIICAIYFYSPRFLSG